jgi:hypothetical protein
MQEYRIYLIDQNGHITGPPAPTIRPLSSRQKNTLMGAPLKSGMGLAGLLISIPFMRGTVAVVSVQYEYGLCHFARTGRAQCRARWLSPNA